MDDDSQDELINKNAAVGKVKRTNAVLFSDEGMLKWVEHILLVASAFSFSRNWLCTVKNLPQVLYLVSSSVAS